MKGQDSGQEIVVVIGPKDRDDRNAIAVMGDPLNGARLLGRRIEKSEPSEPEVALFGRRAEMGTRDLTHLVAHGQPWTLPNPGQRRPRPRSRSRH